MQQHERLVKRKKKNSYMIRFILVICIMVTAFILVMNDRNPEKHIPSPMPQTNYADNNADSNSKNNSREKANKNAWWLVLVNQWNPIEKRDKIKTTILSNGERVDERIYPDLQKMFDAARNDGVYPIVVSGYRTEQEQKEIYNNKLAAYLAEGLSDAEAKKETELWVAIPGTSEHQLGLAVDINADGIHSKGTQVYQWLEQHAHLYGFIKRYSSDKTEITGVANEPWHYRYVGVRAATELYDQGICLEEYLGKVN